MYPPYSKDTRDVLEVLDYELLSESCATLGPSRSPLKRAEVIKLVDAHDFGGRSSASKD